MPSHYNDPMAPETHEEYLEKMRLQDPFLRTSEETEGMLRNQIRDEMNLAGQEFTSAKQSGDPERVRSAIDLFKYHKERLDTMMDPQNKFGLDPGRFFGPPGRF